MRSRSPLSRSPKAASALATAPRTTMTIPKATPLVAPLNPTSGLARPPKTNWTNPSSAEPVPAHRPVRQ